ncbi:MAG TPA: HAMP domain-containing sensor histidine kinase [Spirochaetota bacterium]|nr:HAMP domain-containing sensor histidine kinase [Spirochaetota bacterium]
MITLISVVLIFSFNKKNKVKSFEGLRNEYIIDLKNYYKEIEIISSKIREINQKALNKLISIIEKDKKYNLDSIARSVGVDYIYLIDEKELKVYDSNFEPDIGHTSEYFGGRKLVEKIRGIKENKDLLHLRLSLSTLTGIAIIYSYIYSPKGFYIEVGTDFLSYIEKNYSKGYKDYLTKDFFKKFQSDFIIETELFFQSNDENYWSLSKRKLEQNILVFLKEKESFYYEKDDKFFSYHKIYFENDYYVILKNTADFKYFSELKIKIFYGLFIFSIIFLFLFYVFYIKTNSKYISRIDEIISIIKSLSDKSITKDLYKDEIDYIKDVIIKVKDNIEKREKELIEANKNLEEALAIKTAFLANANHELRTPLTGILGMLYILSQSGLTKEQLEYVNIIEESAHNLYNIIKNILTFSKIKTGGIKPEAKEIDILDFFNNTVFKYKQEAEKKGLYFNMRIDTEHKSILSYPSEIKEILIHLLSNAIKFTKTGGITIYVSTESINNNRLLVVKVSDTGVGIPKEKINFILKEFAQVDLSDTRKYGGLGLGLTIVKEMVNFLGGYTLIDSDKNGTTITFKIPYYFKEKKEIVKNIEDSNNINVIVTTKDQVTKSILVSFFNSNEINYIITEDPNEVITYVTQINAHFIIIDSDVLKNYKGDIIVDIKKRTKDIKIILITDFYNDKLSDILYIRGIYKTIKKPVTINIISDVFKKK